MTRTILLTGATDGIGLETAKRLAADGHTLLIHGRSAEKLTALQQELAKIRGDGQVETFRADLSDLSDVALLADSVGEKHPTLDALINNAGVFTVPKTQTKEGYDIRFMVNTIAPYLLTTKLLPRFSQSGRVINLASAAQAPVDLEALNGNTSLTDNDAYAQSKLAITMWSFHLAQSISNPAIIAVNPASFLGSKMVKEAYGKAGNDLGIGADILVSAALDSEFANASGRYFDNDKKRFSDPHPDALDAGKNQSLVDAIEKIIEDHVGVT